MTIAEKSTELGNKLQLIKMIGLSRQANDKKYFEYTVYGLTHQSP